MINQLWVRRGRLETPVYCFVHPPTGRRATIVALTHTGEAQYYTKIREVIGKLERAGATVYREGTGMRKLLDNPPPDLTEIEREALDALVERDTVQWSPDLQAGSTGTPCGRRSRPGSTPTAASKPCAGAKAGEFDQ